MTAFLSLGGKRVTDVDLSIPQYGTWAADVETSDGAAAPAKTALTIGSLVLTCAVDRSAEVAGGRKYRLLGGYGGWPKMLASRSYSLAGGVPLGMVLSDAAMELGERVTLAAQSNVGTAFVRPAMTGAALLALAAGPLWWMDPAGLTHVASARPSKAITSPFTLVDRDGGRGIATIATENYEDWTPGNTFKAPTMASAATISQVSIRIASSDGKARLTVMTDGRGLQ